MTLFEPRMPFARPAFHDYCLTQCTSRASRLAKEGIYVEMGAARVRLRPDHPMMSSWGGEVGVRSSYRLQYARHSKEPALGGGGGGGMDARVFKSRAVYQFKTEVPMDLKPSSRAQCMNSQDRNADGLQRTSNVFKSRAVYEESRPKCRWTSTLSPARFHQVGRAKQQGCQVQHLEAACTAPRIRLKPAEPSSFRRVFAGSKSRAVFQEQPRPNEPRANSRVSRRRAIAMTGESPDAGRRSGQPPALYSWLTPVMKAPKSCSRIKIRHSSVYLLLVIAHRTHRISAVSGEVVDLQHPPAQTSAMFLYYDIHF
ncbi:hypothetical protein BC835DRAFT_1304568 [Cytidiella melzeri]|nr:hypothetical protein BC835DRAFT_1304568 [Cytidiella melzeri]